jgi:hypothetical protein
MAVVYFLLGTMFFLGHGKNAISALEETLCKVSVYRLSYRLSRGRFVKINVVSVM